MGPATKAPQEARARRNQEAQVPLNHPPAGAAAASQAETEAVKVDHREEIKAEETPAVKDSVRTLSGRHLSK